jgi:hypothetical protein
MAASISDAHSLNPADEVRRQMAIFKAGVPGHGKSASTFGRLRTMSNPCGEE